MSFQHHDALEGAQAAAQVIIQACHSSAVDIEGWLEPPIPLGRFCAGGAREAEQTREKEIVERNLAL